MEGQFMTDYSELVKALRCKSLSKECDSCDYGYHLSHDSECNDACHVEQIYADAAAAIEELWADNDILHQHIEDMNEAFRDKSVECQKAAKRNAELHAELERWVSAAEMAGLVVRCKECIHFTQSGWCDREFDWFPVDKNDFCSMAEKMEAQDERTD